MSTLYRAIMLCNDARSLFRIVRILAVKNCPEIPRSHNPSIFLGCASSFRVLPAVASCHQPHVIEQLDS